MQDECTFYANDRRHSGWKHLDAGSDPHLKGEGTSLMVSDFVSADRGWCRSPDGKESTRVLFRAGKAQDGWFTSDDILKQATTTMDILKRADGALSAHYMPKSTRDWGVETTLLGEDRKPIHSTDGKLQKTKL